MIRILISFVLLFCTPFAQADNTNNQPLLVSQAFVPSVQVTTPDTLTAHWQIAPGYYLYQSHFQFKILSPRQARLAQPMFPPAQALHNAALGDLEVYADEVSISLPLRDPAPQNITLLMTYQGCSESGFCYPPVTQKVQANLITSSVQLEEQDTRAAALAMPPIRQANSDSNSSQFTHLFNTHHVFWLILSFLGFGILLAFTPCVLPMIPILVSIIAGQHKHINTRKAFLLSLTYVLSMAFTFAIAGVIAGLVGYSLQAALQNPWVISVFSLLFILLALSMFGFYELQLPRFLHHRLHHYHQKQSGGSYVSVAIMGCLATLIASPCVSAPLVGALSYISSTGNAVLGGVALFALGLGMGIPLLILGTSGGKFLPKSGAWMVKIKAVFGVLLIAVAILMLGRILPGPVNLLLWGAFAIICGIYLGAFDKTERGAHLQKFWKGCGLILGFYGLLLIVGAATGQSDPFKPLSHFVAQPTVTQTTSVPANNFHRATNLAQVQKLLQQAKAENKPVLIDFYADWCLDCLAIKKTVFDTTPVQTAWQGVMLIQADVTANDANSRALEQAYQVFAPPSLIFINAQGVETQRLVGSIDAKTFLKALQTAQVQPV